MCVCVKANHHTTFLKYTFWKSFTVMGVCLFCKQVRFKSPVVVMVFLETSKINLKLTVPMNCGHSCHYYTLIIDLSSVLETATQRRKHFHSGRKVPEIAIFVCFEQICITGWILAKSILYSTFLFLIKKHWFLQCFGKQISKD